ncbi:uncharacterized protein PFLUO_LOCUS2669 [Penicillium psychrofluorescens]|uniref:uncharacterized protein n=1 Tax=Penicillium psychrofluorescens TaxID=3158075 RepID=UPI003CCD526B
MVPSACWNCVLRPRAAATRALLPPSSSAPRVASAPFHSSAAQYAQPAKKKANTQTMMKHRQSMSIRRKKKKPVDRVRPPPVGERKALKKRIVLSNPNALEIEGMADLSAETMSNPSLRGTIMGLPVDKLDQLRAVEAFKPKQSWSLFRRPSTVFRRSTYEMGRLIDQITGDVEGAQQGKVVKKIVTGPKGSGKTVHLLQAMTMAFIKKWVVITVPDARELVSGDTAYSPIEGTNPTQYVQPNATSTLLSRVVKANQDVLAGLRISQQHPALKGLKPGSTLADLAKLGLQDAAVAWPVFQALWTELNATKAAPGVKDEFQPRPPMLVTLDGLAHWMGESVYRAADYTTIHSHDLVFVNHFLSLLTQGQTLGNGGLVLYATSTSNSPSNYSLEVGLDQLAARQEGVKPSSPEYPQPESYSDADPRVMDLFQASMSKDGLLELQTLSGLTRDETRSYVTYFARSGLLREVVNDQLVGEKWSLSGGGVIGELEKVLRRPQLSRPQVATATA